MNIDEVTEILGLCHALRAPKHVFITDEQIYKQQNGKVFYRGLQPEAKRDAIVISRDGDASTVPHEVWHANTGLGEFTAVPLGKLMGLKAQLVKQFPSLKSLVSRKVRYRRVESCEDYPEAHSSKFKNRIKHYVRVE